MNALIYILSVQFTQMPSYKNSVEDKGTCHVLVVNVSNKYYFLF